MKLAITGKGGVGKTTLTAALARTYGRLGNSVVAVDADPNPNLGIALGLGVERTDGVAGVANVVNQEKAAHSHDASPTTDLPAKEAEDFLDALGVTASDGVRLLQTGRIERPGEGCLCCGSHRTTREIFDGLAAEDRIVLADLEAGVTDLCWTDPKPADGVVVVATPDRSAVEVARRALQVTSDLGVTNVVVVVNRVEGGNDAQWVRDLLPGADVVEIPEDPTIAEAERRCISPLEIADDCPAMLAVQSLSGQLLRA